MSATRPSSVAAPTPAPPEQHRARVREKPIIKVVLAKTSVDLLAAGLAPREAARQAVALLAKHTGEQAGVILMDRLGAIGYAHNAEEMPVCHIIAGREPVTAF